MTTSASSMTPVQMPDRSAESVKRRMTHLLERVYGETHDIAPITEQLLGLVEKHLTQRAEDLRALDIARQAKPDWHTGTALFAYSTYVDKFGGTLQGVQKKIDYLQTLGVNYLHLLPFLKMRDGESDGGFAVENFTQVEPRLGTFDDLINLCATLRERNISLCSDFVLNHVADTHEWAVKAKGGDPFYQAFFYLKDRAQADAFEASLNQIFPQTAPGNFVWEPSIGKWVWSTFYQYQWDLNYSNPHVLIAMLDNLLTLANAGIEIFRLDSAAFLWKRLGTTCTNQPECHWLLQIFRAVCELACPGVLLKAEAIVPTAELPPYLATEGNQSIECHLAYQSSFMAGVWYSLANQEGKLITQMIRELPTISPHCTWISYIRCHDDIGWNVLKPELNNEGMDKLRHASRFFAGNAQGSYSHGQGFQTSNDAAVHGTNGMLSALLGLDSDCSDELAFARYQLVYAWVFSTAGIPMIYMGDELAQGNAPSDTASMSKWVDGRDLHRPSFDEHAYQEATKDHNCLASKAFHWIKKLRHLQTQHLLAGNTNSLSVLSDLPDELCGFWHKDVLCLFNFSAKAVDVSLPLPGQVIDLLSNTPCQGQMTLTPYQSLWLKAS